MNRIKVSADELNLIKLAQEYADEKRARKLFESWRWPGGKPICPHCQHDEAYQIQSRPETKHPARQGLYGCAACRKTFTATVGTVLEDSHLPISKWLMAIFILCASKKSVSANQLHRMLGVTYKTAWFMAHRLRFAMTPNHWAEPKLKGTVEVDETFVGGRGEGGTRLGRQSPVVALVERGGRARVKVVASVTQKNLGAALQECVDPSARVNTDEHPSYKNPLKAWKEHHAVNHSRGEYQRQNADGSVASINTAESFFSLLKRGVIGAWHHVSQTHLPKYANEFAFRWSHRSITDGERMRRFVPMIAHKRITYRATIQSNRNSALPLVFPHFLPP
jgi:transposase-like protein